MKKIKSLIIGLLICLSSHAQDILSNQFYFNPMSLNPALAGSDVRLRVITQTAKPWVAIPRNIMKNTISVDMILFPFDREKRANFHQRFIAGMGVSYESIAQGIGTFTIHQPSLAFSGKLFLDKAMEYSWVAVGYQLSHHSITQNWSKFTFSDQIDPDLGKVSSVTSLPLQTYANRDFSAAIGAVGQIRLGSKLKKDFPAYLRLGMSMYNFGRIDRSYTMPSEDNEYPVRYSFFTKYNFPMRALNFTDYTFVSLYNRFDFQGRSYRNMSAPNEAGRYRDFQLMVIVNHENKKPSKGFYSFIWGLGTKSTFSGHAKHDWLSFLLGVSHPLANSWDIQYNLSYASAISTPNFLNSHFYRSNYGTIEFSILLRYDRIKCNSHRRDDSWL